MTKVFRWSSEEERVLIDQVTRHAYNLAEAFREASRLIDRSSDACKQHWYHTLSKKGINSVCLATIGYKTKNINRKVVRANTSDNTENTTISWWKRFINFLLGK